MNAKARRLQQRAQISHRRALAVGAGDMDHRRQLAFGMAEPFQQALDALEGKFGKGAVRRGQALLSDSVEDTGTDLGKRS